MTRSDGAPGRSRRRQHPALADLRTILLLEATDDDAILAETVGVGQSAVTVARMVDTPARTGDRLQGIKKGVLELPDIGVVNKAYGEQATEGYAAARELAGLIRPICPRETLWSPTIFTMSALHGTDLTELWDTVLKPRGVLTEAGECDARRRTQQVKRTWSRVRDTVLDRVLTRPVVRGIRADNERQVRDGEPTPALAAQQILDAADHR